MDCDLLKNVISRACDFSRREDIAQNCIFKAKSNRLEIRTSNGVTGICINPDFDIALPDMECALNVYALDEALKIFDQSSNLKIYLKNNKLIISDDSNKIRINTMDIDTVFYTPKPQNWIKAPSDFGDKINTIRSISIRNMKGIEKDSEDTIIIKNNNICQISRSVYLFEKTDTNINISVLLKYLKKLPDIIESYCVENNRIYFKGIDEWCMFALDSRTVPKYEMLFTEVQKTNNYVIRVNREDFLVFCEKLLSLKKVEELSILNSNQYRVCLEFSNNKITGKTEVGDVEINVESNAEFICYVVTDFIKAISHKVFAKNEEVELHIGKGMSLFLAVCGTTNIIGAICRA